MQNTLTKNLSTIFSDFSLTREVGARISRISRISRTSWRTDILVGCRACADVFQEKPRTKSLTSKYRVLESSWEPTSLRRTLDAGPNGFLRRANPISISHKSCRKDRIAYYGRHRGCTVVIVCHGTSFPSRGAPRTHYVVKRGLPLRSEISIFGNSKWITCHFILVGPGFSTGPAGSYPTEY